MLQWINGVKPPDVIEHCILVIGPDDYSDERYLRSALDGYTLRMEAVRVLIDGVGNCGVHRPEGFTYDGVHRFAYEWACRNMWPVELHDLAWWKGKRDKMNATILEKLVVNGRRHTHCLAFWERGWEGEELMELAREVVPMRNFKLVEIL